MQLFDQLTAAQASSLHHWDGGRFERRTWAEMLAEARRMAAGLRDAGVRPGVVLATVLTNSYESVAGLMGAWLAGGAVASLPIPARGMSIEDYAAQLGQLCEQVQSPMLVLDEKLLRAVPESLGQQVPIRSWESLPRDATIELTPPEEDDLAFVQYSSGSTRMPKGCMLTARAIGNQLDIVADMVSAVPGDERVVSWLPLSHDMGVFGCLLYSWAWDFELALSTPMRFVYDPLSWFADLSDFRGTLSAGTPSALHVAVRAHRGSGFDGDLAALRACVIGAERVSIQTLDAASDAFAACGLSRAAWLPAYGLAEATLVVSTIGLDEEPVSIDVDRNALTEGEIREASPAVTAATSLVSMGRACDGVEVRLEDPGRLSEILVRSKSLAGGYFGQPELTAERFGDGELRTGDLGFERDGELYVVGRSDDLLSVAGRNVYARGIEEAVDMLEP
ncbi:MAG: AMP-binding protein, partial [Thermoleophilaceae bacterium]